MTAGLGITLRAATLALVALAAAATLANGQRSPPPPLDVACPPGSGLVIRTDAGPGDSSSAAGRLSNARERDLGAHPIDTTFAFDITERTWTRSYFAASLALGLGVGGASGEAGMTGATASRANGPWRACVGAAVSMQRPTLTLRGVHGQVHLRIDPGPLAQAATQPPARRPDSTARPRR